MNGQDENLIELRQGSYWRALADIEVADISHRDERETPIVIPAGTVLLLQSIRDVGDSAHTIILRPHPSVYGMAIYRVEEYRDGKVYSRSWGELKEYRFLVADFLNRFAPEPDAQPVRARELAAAQERVQQLQQRLIVEQNDPALMRPVLALGISKWEQERGLDRARAAEIASMSTSTALVPTLTNKHVENLKLRAEREHTLATTRATWIKERIEEIGHAVQALMPYMEEQAAAALAQTEDVIRKVANIQKGIESLDLYIGKNVVVETLATGRSAPENIPLTIAQRKLFMQEEFSVWAEVTEEFDFHKEEQFLKALKDNESLRRQIFPSERSIVCMATRRTDKDYGDPWIGANRNAINKEVFLLVRDGENLHRIFSPVESHVRALQLFPSRSETDTIFAGANGANINFMDTRYTDRLEKHELIALHYKRFLILLAGLDHRLNLFGTFYDGPKSARFVSLEFQHEHFRFVHDADGEGMLPAASRPSLDEWLKGANIYLRAGSRVMCLWENLANPKTAPGIAKEQESGRHGYYLTRYPEKDHEVCIVTETKGELVVYCATQSRSWRSSETKLMQSRVSLSAFQSNYYRAGFGYLVLDAIKAGDLEWYIHDRDSRARHLEYIKLFKETLAYLREQERLEEPARGLLLAALSEGAIGSPEERGEIVDVAVRSWRAENRGAMLPSSSDGARWTEMLDTMYTIANAASLVPRIDEVAGSLGRAPLRLTVTGGNKLVLYAAPIEEEQDNRITPHIWVHKFSLDVRKAGVKIARQQWAVLPAAEASETTIHEWTSPAASSARWAGLKSPFSSFEEKQRLFSIVDGRTVIDSPWLKDSVKPDEWHAMYAEWLTAYRRNNHGASRVRGASILFPVGLSVHLEKNTVHLLAVHSTSPEVRLWDLAPSDQERGWLSEQYASVYRHSGQGREKLKNLCQTEGRRLSLITTEVPDLFPKADFEYRGVALLRPGGSSGSYQDTESSLDWRYARAVDYVNKYKARYQVPFLIFYLSPEIQRRTLDAVFGHYSDAFVTPSKMKIGDETDSSDE